MSALPALLGTALFVEGAVAATVMLEVLGRPAKSEDPEKMRSLHRLLGWIFVIGLAVMIALMMPRAYWHAVNHEPYSNRAFAHVFLSLAVVPLVVVKVAMARRYTVYSRALPVLGPAILSVLFVILALVVGHEAMELFQAGG
jgi:hypothetical protein